MLTYISTPELTKQILKSDVEKALEGLLSARNSECCDSDKNNQSLEAAAEELFFAKPKHQPQVYLFVIAFNLFP